MPPWAPGRGSDDPVPGTAGGQTVRRGHPSVGVLGSIQAPLIYANLVTNSSRGWASGIEPTGQKQVHRRLGRALAMGSRWPPV